MEFRVVNWVAAIPGKSHGTTSATAVSGGAVSTAGSGIGRAATGGGSGSSAGYRAGGRDTRPCEPDEVGIVGRIGVAGGYGSRNRKLLLRGTVTFRKGITTQIRVDSSRLPAGETNVVL